MKLLVLYFSLSSRLLSTPCTIAFPTPCQLSAGAHSPPLPLATYSPQHARVQQVAADSGSRFVSLDTTVRKMSAKWGHCVYPFKCSISEATVQVSIKFGVTVCSSYLELSFVRHNEITTDLATYVQALDEERSLEVLCHKGLEWYNANSIRDLTRVRVLRQCLTGPSVPWTNFVSWTAMKDFTSFAGAPRQCNAAGSTYTARPWRTFCSWEDVKSETNTYSVHSVCIRLVENR
jgi:hypothetical protein